MTDYLGSVQQFTVDTQHMVDEVLVSGQKIQYDFNTRLTVQRPDKMRAERTEDLNQQVFVYDGKTLTIFNPEQNYYAAVSVPDNLDDLLHFSRDSLDIVPPSGDMVFTNAFDLLMAGVTSSGVVGKSVIEGVKCDHLVFTSSVVDWQIWIADGDKPLPYKYVLTTKDDPAFPQYIVLMRNWNVAPKLSEEMFGFTPPPGAKKTDFLRTSTSHKAAR